MYKALYCVLAIVIGATIGFLLCEPATPLLRMMEESAPVPTEPDGLFYINRIVYDPTFPGWQPNCTGFAVDQTYIGTVVVTASHCLAEGEPVQVRALFNDVTYSAVVLAVDRSVDTALLLVPGCRAPYIFTMNPKLPALGEELSAWSLVPLGVVRLTGMAQAAKICYDYYAPPFAMILTSIPLYPGCSGGPVLNSEGEVVGISAWKFEQTVMSGVTPIQHALEMLLSM